MKVDVLMVKEGVSIIDVSVALEEAVVLSDLKDEHTLGFGFALVSPLACLSCLVSLLQQVAYLEVESSWPRALSLLTNAFQMLVHMYPQPLTNLSITLHCILLHILVCFSVK